MPKTGNGTTADGIDHAGRKTTTPLVSVIIPAYNAEAFIRATLSLRWSQFVGQFGSRFKVYSVV